MLFSGKGMHTIYNGMLGGGANGNRRKGRDYGNINMKDMKGYIFTCEMKLKEYFHNVVYVMNCVVDKMVDEVNKRIQYDLVMMNKVEVDVQTLGYYYLLLLMMMQYYWVLHCCHTMNDCCFEQKALPCILVLLQHPFQPSL